MAGRQKRALHRFVGWPDAPPGTVSSVPGWSRYDFAPRARLPRGVPRRGFIAHGALTLVGPITLPNVIKMMRTGQIRT